MSLLDADLTEKIDIPMIFDAIDKLRKVMDDNLEKIAMHEKEMSALYKNVSSARSELRNVSALLEQITNPQPKCNDISPKLGNIDLIDLYGGSITGGSITGGISGDLLARNWYTTSDLKYNPTPCIWADSRLDEIKSYINDEGCLYTTTSSRP